MEPQVQAELSRLHDILNHKNWKINSIGIEPLIAYEKSGHSPMADPILSEMLCGDLSLESAKTLHKFISVASTGEWLNNGVKNYSTLVNGGAKDHLLPLLKKLMPANEYEAFTKKYPIGSDGWAEFLEQVS
ncbi:MAG: hypothetical protein WAK48_02240 [Candidatus Acidiferrum sp.]|jgi:hypothetical protein